MKAIFIIVKLLEMLFHILCSNSNFSVDYMCTQFVHLCSSLYYSCYTDNKNSSICNFL